MVKQVKPQKIEGKVDIGGKTIKIGSDAIPSIPGGTQQEVIRGLKKASEKIIFSSPFEINGANR